MMLVLSWLRLELRRRWRSLAVLAVLVAVSAGVVMTTIAAARRGETALHRLAARVEPATIALLPNTPGFDWAPIAHLPSVAALTKFVVDYDMQADGISGNGLGFPFADDAFGRTLETPVVFKGRMFDPSRADEAVVTRKFVRSYHKGVGDTVTLRLPSAAQLASGDTPTTYAGPVVTVHIVGVVVSTWVADSPDSPGGLQVSPGLVAKYPLETIGDPKQKDTVQFVNALIRLKDPTEAGVRAFRNDVQRVTGRDDIGEIDLLAQQHDIQHNIDFESRCLWAFAAAAFVAALFLVGQAIARYAAASTQELQTLRALGMTPAQAMATAAAGPTLVGAVGGLAAAVGAWVASSHFPYGTADYFEPSPGRSLDWLVLATGVAISVALVAAGAVGAAWLALNSARRSAAARRSAVATAVARSGASVPVMVGTRFALETGRGRTSVPVRPALIGAVMGVVGVVAAFTFSHGVSDAADHPERFGQTFQLGLFLGINNQDFGPGADLDRVLLAHPKVTGLDDSRSAVANTADGRADVALWEYAPTAKPTHIVILDGHTPDAADDVVLGPKTIAALHTHVGGTISLIGTSKKPVALHVVGAGLTVQGPHNGYADGGWISSGGYQSLFGKDFKYHLILISIPHGANANTTAKQLEHDVAAALPTIQGGVDIEPGDVPTEVAEIRQVRTLPVVLGGFLGLLAIGAVGHAVATAVRRRSHDLAVLRAVGMTQWQCRWVVVTQATVLAVVGLAFGIPIGFAIGRTVWRSVADYTPIQYVPPLATWALLLVGPGALVVANLLAAWPGRRAARLRVATILRAE